ncbi:AMP-dependent synthetase/ligase [Actinosynnema mirum]|uniref:Acyl-CoA synthetase n=1 Tax=Actinosynnema mirum (strain ATCC 29888 / DSM 43827 / JCM 3225 / NBRC 14064 / NCIMB 13271 / NRRL B-12336 / IMRU 3971 / 101) TaxID=446462 RepID=C6WK06_ACTMD|nr:AMP-dependent synthetase/ligase [Actinosynnema mirum]ACU38219.1 AMP-dependent synthetase and ligase [Actinosynnema mirum DSM 43827]
MTTTAELLHESAQEATITRLLRHDAERFPDHPALTSGGTTLTWSRLRAEVATLTRGLAALGIRRGDRVLIAMSKRPEHWITDLAAVHLGALPCSTYDTLSTEQIGHIARHSNASTLVLEGAEQLARWRPVLDDLPNLRTVVVLDPDALPPGDPRFVGYAELRGEPATPDAAFEALTDAVGPTWPLTLVYTSGTTGDPKGVVLSHRNAVYESLAQEHLVPGPEHPRTVAYLPMAHIAERVLGVYLPICNAGHVTTCPDPKQLLPTLLAVRPHGIFGVPRVWEKLVTGLRAELAALPPEHAAPVEAARRAAFEAHRLRAEGAEVPAELAERVRHLDDAVLRPIRAAIGLDECVRAYSGAAPIPVPVLEFLAGLGLPVLEVWGLSETTGAATVSTPDRFATGAVGAAMPGVEVDVAEDGELLVRGPVVCEGYLRADGGIDPVTDGEGWLRTGDVGAIDERGLVTITDRKKELIITDGGKNIAPTKVEALLRAHPLVGQAVVIGDRRPYLTALLVLDEDAAPAWAAAHGITTGLPELAEHAEVLAALDHAVAEANAPLSRAEQVKAHRVLPGPWTAESGELTPKLSLRRKAVAELHAATIDSMYT